MSVNCTKMPVYGGQLEDLSERTKTYICQAAARNDRALSHTRDTIVLGAVQLSETMPVNGGSIIHEVVGDVDFEMVAPVGLEEIR